MRPQTISRPAVFHCHLPTVCRFSATFVRPDQASVPFQILTWVKVVIGEPFESQLKILQMANLCKKTCMFQKKVVPLQPKVAKS